MSCMAMGQIQLPSKEPFPPHAISNTTSSDTAGSQALGQCLEFLQIVDPEQMNKGQPSVPKTLCLLQDKVNCLTPTIQNLQDLTKA